VKTKKRGWSESNERRTRRTEGEVALQPTTNQPPTKTKFTEIFGLETCNRKFGGVKGGEGGGKFQHVPVHKKKGKRVTQRHDCSKSWAQQEKQGLGGKGQEKKKTNIKSRPQNKGQPTETQKRANNATK